MERLVWALRGCAVIGVLSVASQPALARTAADGRGATCVSRHVDAQATQLADPEMPPIAAMMHATGSVKVLVDLDESGKLKGTSVLASSGNAALDRAALETVRESEFSPEKIDCQGVAGSYAVIVDFPE